MDSIVVHFILLLFTFQAVKSDELQISELVKEVLGKGFDSDDIPSSSENDNSTSELKFGLSGEQILDNEKLKIKRQKLQLANQLLEHLMEITKLRTNTTIYLLKMIDDVENFQHTIMRLPRKQMGPFDKSTLQMMELEEIIYFEAREKMSKEYKKSWNQLQTLKIKLYAWCKDIQSEIEKSSEIASAIDKFSRDELESENSFDDQSENSQSNFDTQEDDPELKVLEKIASMTNDQYNKEKPKESPDKDKIKQAVESEIYTQNILSEEAEFPRWILTHKDIEEIQNKYLTWMELFEHSQASQIQSLKEAVINSGQSIKLFCKTLAEYNNITNILSECKSKHDTECVEMMDAMLDQPHFKEFIELFSSWKSSEGLS